jgi:hypothetical protein
LQSALAMGETEPTASAVVLGGIARLTEFADAEMGAVGARDRSCEALFISLEVAFIADGADVLELMSGTAASSIRAK